MQQKLESHFKVTNSWAIGKRVILREPRINLAFKVDKISTSKGKGKEVSSFFLLCSLHMVDAVLCVLQMLYYLNDFQDVFKELFKVIESMKLN